MARWGSAWCCACWARPWCSRSTSLSGGSRVGGHERRTLRQVPTEQQRPVGELGRLFEIPGPLVGELHGVGQDNAAVVSKYGAVRPVRDRPRGRGGERFRA